MPLVTLGDSPLAGGLADIYYREFGSGVPLVFLHGGWGYEIYPLDEQARAGGLPAGEARNRGIRARLGLREVRLLLVDVLDQN